MQRTIIKSGVVFILLALFTACYFCIKGKGEMLTTTVETEAFTEIKINIASKITLIKGEKCGVQISAQQSILRSLSIKSARDVLVVSSRRCIRHYKPVELVITLPQINKIKLNGSAKLAGESIFDTDRLELELNGSGMINLRTNANNIETEINGSGKIILAGSSRDIEIDINGSGNIYAKELEVQDAEIEIAGSGKCEIFVKDKMDVEITGSGDVFYIGNPDIKSRITGSGKVEKLPVTFE